MSTDNREDYLINILRLTEGKGVVKTTELATYMNVAPASVTDMLKVLQKEGLVNYERYKGVSLTEQGDRTARDLRRKHHIMERFLTDVLEVEHSDAHNQACAVEHTISDDVANKICRIIGTRVDEDCTTCSNPCPESGRAPRMCQTLAELKSGDRVEISHITSEDSALVRKLISLGFVPGRDAELLSVISDRGARIIRVGDTSIALDFEMCKAVHVDKK